MVCLSLDMRLAHMHIINLTRWWCRSHICTDWPLIFKSYHLGTSLVMGRVTVENNADNTCDTLND